MIWSSKFSLLTRLQSLGAMMTLAVVMDTALVAQQVRPRTELLFLGTAGGPPLRVDRSEPATLLIVDGRPYLIDCGIGTMRRMLRSGIASESVHTIFFTHLHADHDLGLSDVMGNDFFQLNNGSSTQEIAIYGPPQTKELVDAAFQYVSIGFQPFAAEPGAIRAGLVNGQLKSPFISHEISRDGLVYQDDKIRVTAAENSHYALMPASDRQELKSYSYRFETPHGVVVFTGDTGPSDAVVQLASRADVLVAEVEDAGALSTFVEKMATANHWPPQRAAALMTHMREEHLDEAEVGRMAANARAKSVILYHYDPADPAAYVTAVKTIFSGPVFAPSDLDRYCLGAGNAGANTAAPLSKCSEK